jgi:hypothetical protein
MSSGQQPPDPPREFYGEEVSLHPSVDPAIQREALKGERSNARWGRVVGSSIMLAGIAITVLGFTGAVDIGIAIGDVSATVTTGSLGIVVLLVGAFVIWVTRFQYRVQPEGKGAGE